MRPGENLYRIGKAYDISVEELARVNGIKDPKRILSGQRLLIPGARQTVPVETIAPAEIAQPDHGAVSIDPSDETLIWPIAGTLNSGFGARGRLVIPIGDEQTQTLLRVSRSSSGFENEQLGECKFVKLFGKYGWRN